MELITKSPEETFTYGKKIGTYLVSIPTKREALVLCFYGDLGSGKTTFIQGMAKGLEISSFIPSPTYLIVRQYPIKQKLFSNFYHIDLYRVSKNEEIEPLGLFDFFSDSKNIIAIEWAEKLGSNLPKKRLNIKLTMLDDNRRKIEYGESS